MALRSTSTAQQDERFIALFNDRNNTGHFNILFHNCADFSRVVMDIYLPDAIHRSVVADVGITTPKQVARSLVQYSRKHPELEMSAFVIPQVPGTIKRSKPVDGVAQSLVKRKKYLIPMTILTPELTGGLVVAYMAKGRMELPENALVFNVNDNVMEPGEPGPVQAANTGPGQNASPFVCACLYADTRARARCCNRHYACGPGYGIARGAFHASLAPTEPALCKTGDSISIAFADSLMADSSLKNHAFCFALPLAFQLQRTTPTLVLLLTALAAGDGCLGLVVRLALALGGALVPLLLALGQGQFAFDAPAAEVEPRGTG